VLLVVVLMIAAAWASDAVLAAGRPALVALPLGAILVVPIAVKPGLGDVLWFVVTAALYLALLRLGRPRDSRRVVVVVGAAVTLGALLLPNLLPPVGEAETRRGGLRTGLNPFITLGDDLRRGDPTLALSYTTTAKGPVYLRLSTLDEFTGVTWKPSLDPVGDMGTQPVDAFPDPVGLAAETVVAEATVSVTVGGVLSKWLPTPYPTRSIEGVVGDWFWEPNGLAVRTIDSNARGQQYTSTFLEVSPTAELLAGTPTWDPSTAPFDALALPEQGLPEIIASTAHRLGDGAASAFDKALALQTYLRSSQFTYSEQTPVDGGFDGSGLDALAVFFDVKSGYCVHYASAMAVMARELGIPSRVAVGFQPGQRSLADGVSTYEVSTDDLHAWPELYLEGAGWTRFEPTPSRGVVPTFSTLLIDDPTTPEDESSPAPSAAPTTAPGVPMSTTRRATRSPSRSAA
jgi:transglutaminase-like putative cysteine protease